jgi:hypothetical protein
MATHISPGREKCARSDSEDIIMREARHTTDNGPLTADSKAIRYAISAVLLVAVDVCSGRAVAAFGSPVSSDPVFQALLIDGRTVSGRIASFDARAMTLATRQGQKETLPLDRLVKLTRDVPAPVALLDDAQAVMLAEGDRLMRVAIGTASDTSLTVRSELLGKLEIPLESLLGLILLPPSQPAEFDARWDQMLLEPRKTEVVWLQNGDRLAGSFLGLDERKLRIQVEGKPVDLDRSGAVALGFDPALASYPRPPTEFLEVTLSDGSRLGLNAPRLSEGSVQARTRFGHPVRFALAELVRISVRSQAVVYLAERTPAAAQYVPFIGPVRHYRADRTVDGHPFRLAGQTYDRGIGTQSKALLAYRIEPGDRRFQATVGVDERAGPLGSVVFRVLVDSKELFRTPPMTDRDTPRSIDLDVSGGKFLILATEFGERGDARDLADWVEARIIR